MITQDTCRFYSVWCQTILLVNGEPLGREKANEIHCLFTWNAIVSSAVWDLISPWFKVILRWNFHIPFFSAQLTVNIPRNIIAKFQLWAIIIYNYNLQFSPAIDPPRSYGLVTNASGQVARNFAGHLVMSFSQVKPDTWLISYTIPASLYFSKVHKSFNSIC